MPRLTFEERYESIVKEINKRRAKWTLASMDFEDVRQIILAHVAKKLPTFDETKGEFSHWLNSLISSQIFNELRNASGKFQRPCVPRPGHPGGCPFNGGGDACTKTSTGIQCGECLAYRDWEKRKLGHFQVKQTLPIENHTQEVHNVQSDFLDYEKTKTVIDREMKKKLNEHEWKMYRMLFIQGKSEKDVGKALGYKKVGRLNAGYSTILKLRHKVKKLAREIIRDHDLG